MQRAITLGKKGRLGAPPNPWVGCVVVNNDQCVGEGYHTSPGTPHAEVVALQQAGHRAQNATAYVTLEPCSHRGKTPPCTEALIRAGIKRVVIALKDPDPHVNGQGITALVDAGIKVELGMCEEEARASLLAYLHHRETALPFCVAKAAISIDGRLAAQDGTSQWISTEEARQDAHHLRAHSGAIIVGSETALLDQPQLTIRAGDQTRQPLKVIMDRRGRITREDAIVTKASPLEILKELGSRGILQVLIEGGGTLHTSFLKQRLIDQLVLYVGPIILGDEGRPLFHDLKIPTIEQAEKLHLRDSKVLGQTIRLDYVFPKLG